LVPHFGLIKLQVQGGKHLERVNFLDNNFLLLVDQVSVLAIRSTIFA
jgi:hypothetical protein